MKTPICEWAYRNKKGEQVGIVRRFDKTIEGQTTKQTIPYFRADGQAGIPDDMPAAYRLYGLDTLQDMNKPLFVVEGEKCAFALHGLGLQAISSLGGCGSGHHADWSALEGVKEVILMPDNDAQGEVYMKGVHTMLKRLDSKPEVKVVHFPQLPEKGDVVDFLQSMPELEDWNGFTPLADHPAKEAVCSTLLTVVRDLKQAVPAVWNFIVTKSKLKAIDMGSFNRLIIPNRKEMLEPWLLEASINMVFADRGLGKTFFCLSSAIAVANGGEFLTYQAKEAFPVLYLDGEMQAPLMQQRLRMLSGGANTVAPLQIYTPDVQELDEVPDLATKAGQDMIDELIETLGAKAIFIDNISTFMRTGSENEAESWSLVQPWLIKQRKHGRAIVLVHHANKEGKQRGTHKKEDVMDAVIQLKRPDDFVVGEDATRLVVSFTKARHLYGEQVQELEATLITEDNKLVWQCKVADGQFQEVVRLLKEGLLKQNDIADAVGITKGTVSKWKQRALGKGLL